MKDNTFALKMNKSGELLLENSDDAVKAKYKPDSLLLCAPVSYLLMLFCVVIDIAFFRSLRSQDWPLQQMLWPPLQAFWQKRSDRDSATINSIWHCC